MLLGSNSRERVKKSPIEVIMIDAILGLLGGRGLVHRWFVRVEGKIGDGRQRRLG